MEEQEERFFTVVVDSKDEACTMGEAFKAVRRLKDYRGLNYVACDDRVGHMVKKLLEYRCKER